MQNALQRLRILCPKTTSFLALQLNALREDGEDRCPSRTNQLGDISLSCEAAQAQLSWFYKAQGK